MLVSRIDLHKRSDAIELRYLNRLQPRVLDAAAQEPGRDQVIAQQPFARRNVGRIEGDGFLELSLCAPGKTRCRIGLARDACSPEARPNKK